MKTIVNSEQFLYQTSQPTFNLVWLCLKNSCFCKWNKVFICNNINIWWTSYKTYLYMTLWQANNKRIDEDNVLDYARYNIDRWLVVSDPFFSYLLQVCLHACVHIIPPSPFPHHVSSVINSKFAFNLKVFSSVLYKTINKRCSSHRKENIHVVNVIITLCGLLTHGIDNWDDVLLFFHKKTKYMYVTSLYWFWFKPYSNEAENMPFFPLWNCEPLR